MIDGPIFKQELGFVEQETGLEPATTCLEGSRRKTERFTLPSHLLVTARLSDSIIVFYLLGYSVSRLVKLESISKLGIHSAASNHNTR